MSETPEEFRRRMAGYTFRAPVEDAELVEDVDGKPIAVKPAIYAYSGFDEDGEIVGGWSDR